jgi:hypothetical protein
MKTPVPVKDDEVTVGDMVTSHTPIFRATMLAAKPPGSEYASFMDMTVTEFLRTIRPEHFTRQGKDGETLVAKLRELFSEELGRSW